jgi:hypothetical protein
MIARTVSGEENRAKIDLKRRARVELRRRGRVEARGQDNKEPKQIETRGQNKKGAVCACLPPLPAACLYANRLAEHSVCVYLMESFNEVFSPEKF